jgi:hypothetical protein
MLFDSNDNIYFAQMMNVGGSRKWAILGFQYTKPSPIKPGLFYRTSKDGSAVTPIFGNTQQELYVGGSLISD